MNLFYIFLSQGIDKRHPISYNRIVFTVVAHLLFEANKQL
jgi:hypothetical protein